MTLEEAIQQACGAVSLLPPKGDALGRWLRTDAIGKNGKGDGSVMLAEDHVTAWNWQTGEKATTWLNNQRTAEDMRRFSERRVKDRRADQERAANASNLATRMVREATTSPHPYLARKGFPDEQALTLSAQKVRELATAEAGRKSGEYLVPEAGKTAIIVPARISAHISSVQLIWEDGTKKFLFGGNMGGAFHRLATGNDTWLCEGYATGLSLRAALRGLNRQDTVLVCFSASNVAKVSAAIGGRGYIAGDHDRPQPQFGDIGTSEFFARKAGRRYVLPPELGDDFNDMHMKDSIFAVQRLLADFLREGRR